MPAAEACAALLLLAVLAPAQAGAGEEVPSQELLLHLAEFGDADDQYVEPLELERATTAEPGAPAARRTDAPRDEPASDERPVPEDPDHAPR